MFDNRLKLVVNLHFRFILYEHTLLELPNEKLYLVFAIADILKTRVSKLLKI